MSLPVAPISSKASTISGIDSKNNSTQSWRSTQRVSQYDESRFDVFPFALNTFDNIKDFLAERRKYEQISAKAPNIDRISAIFDAELRHKLRTCEAQCMYIAEGYISLIFV